MYINIFSLFWKDIIVEVEQRHWQRAEWPAIKGQVWRKTDKKWCWICGKPYNLRFHHISYLRIGTLDEWKDIVIVCSTHHYLCHFTIFKKIPLTDKALTARYKYLVRHKWRRIRPSHIIDWFISVYAIDTHPKRKSLQW